MPFSLSISGDKKAAHKLAEQQVADKVELLVIKELIDMAPGTHVSISGHFESDSNASHGRLSITGSFWTPTRIT